MRLCAKRIIGALLVLALLTMTAAPALAVSGSSTLASSGGQYIVTASSLNVRSGAGVRYPVIAQARRGTVVTYLSNKAGWWYVRLSNGVKGYVDKQYLTPDSAAKTGYYTVTADKLNVRENPNTGARRKGTLDKGTLVQVTRLNGDWGYMTGGGLSGWVALAYLKAGESGAKPAASIKAGGVYTVLASVLNVRQSGSTSARIIGTISFGTSVRVSRVSGGWALVTYIANGRLKEGWVSAAYLG